MKIKVFVSTGIYGSTAVETIEVDDSLTEGEIDNEVFDYITNNMIEIGWEKE